MSEQDTEQTRGEHPRDDDLNEVEGSPVPDPQEEQGDDEHDAEEDEQERRASRRRPYDPEHRRVGRFVEPGRIDAGRDLRLRAREVPPVRAPQHRRVPAGR